MSMTDRLSKGAQKHRDNQAMAILIGLGGVLIYLFVAAFITGGQEARPIKGEGTVCIPK